MRRIEVECKRCKKRHVVKTLASSLLCCSTLRGVRVLIARVLDEGGARHFVVTSGATVRVHTKDAARTFRTMAEVDAAFFPNAKDDEMKPRRRRKTSLERLPSSESVDG